MTDQEKLDTIRLALQVLDEKRSSLYGAEIQDYVYFVDAVEEALA